MLNVLTDRLIGRHGILTDNRLRQTVVKPGRR